MYVFPLKIIQVQKLKSSQRKTIPLKDVASTCSDIYYFMTIFQSLLKSFFKLFFPPQGVAKRHLEQSKCSFNQKLTSCLPV